MEQLNALLLLQLQLALTAPLSSAAAAASDADASASSVRGLPRPCPDAASRPAARRQVILSADPEAEGAGECGMTMAGT